jgi:predicted metal-dependent enzyme (double-stranded beta helix superfamily)
MTRSLPTPQSAPVLPPAFGCDAGRRLGMLLHRVPAYDWATWGDELARWTLADVAEALRFSSEGYTRTLLAATDDAEVLLLAWLPGQSSPVHGHGESDGLVHILAGHAIEETYALENGQLVRAQERKAWAGDQLRESPDIHHRVLNPGPSLLVTLHLYAPRLTPH